MVYNFVMEKISLNWFIKKLAIFSIFLLLFITTHSKSEGADLNLDPMGFHNLNKPIKPGYSRLTIKREKKFHAASSKANIHVNGKSVVKLPNGKATIYDVKSGGTTVSVTTFMVVGRWSMVFYSEPGANYFIEVTPRVAHFVWGVALGIPGLVLDPTINEDSGTFKMNLIKQEK